MMHLLMQAAASPADNTSLVAIGISIITALVGAIGLLFKLLLASKDREITSKDDSVKAILAERANALPLVATVDKLASTVAEQTGVMREVRDTNTRLAQAMDRNTSTIERVVDKAIDAPQHQEAHR